MTTLSVVRWYLQLTLASGFTKLGSGLAGLGVGLGMVIFAAGCVAVEGVAAALLSGVLAGVVGAISAQTAVESIVNNAVDNIVLFISYIPCARELFVP